MDLDGNIEARDQETIAAGCSSSILHKEGKRSDLKEDSELGLGGGGGDIGEHALLLDEDLENIRDHSSRVSEGVLLAQVEADELLIGRVVKDGTEISRSKELALTNLSGLLDAEPLSIIHEEELKGARIALDGNHIDGTRAIDTHTSSSLVATSDANQLVTRPDSKDGADGKVGVDNGGSVKRVKGNRETLSSHGNRLRDLL